MTDTTWDVCPCDRCEFSREEQAALGWLVPVLWIALIVCMVWLGGAQ